MAKFYGEIGYAVLTETSLGVWTDTWTRRNYSGDVIRNITKLEPSDKVNDNITISNIISIVSDDFAALNFQWIKYVQWMGAKWKVTNIEVKRPRLLLTIGGVYNE